MKKISLKNVAKITCFVVGILFMACTYRQPSNVQEQYEDDIEYENVEDGVYVVGYEENAQGISVAKLWKNGVAQNLTAGTRSSEANSVYVSGSDVYVALKDDGIAKLWKNGTLQNFTKGEAKSVFVSGSDVYVTGRDGANGIFWKNGAMQIIDDRYDLTEFNSIFVSSGDVYIAGYGRNYYKGDIAKLWKNGIAQDLTEENSYSAVANSVFISGNDIYVAGKESKGRSNYFGAARNMVAVLWKNGVAQDLTGETNWAAANSVFVSGNEVYVAGYKRIERDSPPMAMLWENGVAQNLTDGRRDADAYSVFVSGNDIYVAGYEYNGVRTVAKLWINGIAQDLTDGNRNSRASCVFVVSKRNVSKSDFSRTKTVVDNSVNFEKPVTSSYYVIRKTYFHNEPYEETIRKAFLVEGDEIDVLEIRNGFGYVEFINIKEQKTIGWIKMSDLSN